MTYLATIGTIMILGFLYWRMVKREIPQPVGWLQALLPIAIGMLSHPLALPFSMGYMKALANNPNTLKLSELNFFQALGRDFILAGGLEEIAKLVIIVVILLIFRKKVKNVYEYILIGACVGIGFINMTGVPCKPIATAMLLLLGLSPVAALTLTLVLGAINPMSGGVSIVKAGLYNRKMVLAAMTTGSVASILGVVLAISMNQLLLNILLLIVMLIAVVSILKN